MPDNYRIVIVLRDRRLTHMQEVHRVAVGDSMRVGRVNGLIGTAEVLRLQAQRQNRVRSVTCTARCEPGRIRLSLLPWADT